MYRLTVHWGEEVRVLRGEPGQNLLDLLAQNEIILSAPCKGNGSCKKCRVRYRSASRTEEVLACQTLVEEDAELWVPLVRGGGLTDYQAQWQGTGFGIGAALDIGTTTVAAVLVDCASGKSLDSGAVLNPQQACGSDVISRIAACAEGKLELQTGLIRKAAASLLEELCRRNGIGPLNALTLCGNTTMLHLFCGVDPSPIGQAPFTPVFTRMRTYSGSQLGLPAETVYVLPSASGYIGSDIVCGILSQRLDQGGVRLLADLGTNGELALYTGTSLACTSTAAGPALEGANIECGTGGIPGAVCSVSLSGEELVLHTVEEKPPLGICGSGLVDLIALLLDAGLIDESGGFAEDCPHPLARRLRDGRFLLTDTLWLSQKDIRQFQLAKAAVHAGILSLCGYAGIDPSSVEELLIAGGLGFYLHRDSALRTGLIPEEFAGKIRSVGNSGLAGAALCLLPENRERAAAAAESLEICELNSDPDFMERFVDGMSFD